MSSIELRDVTVDAAVPGGTVRLLEPTSLVLAEHRVALIGANGSGKSTLARLINGLVSPSAGTVTVDGLDVARHGRRVRQRVGFCFTDPAAQLVMPTVIEDVAVSLRHTQRRRDERQTAALAVLAEFGLKELAHRSVHTLSGGQRQLLALAGVLATGPTILVADEPTTLLDLRNATVIGDRLLELGQQLVLVTHDLELAARCDRVVCLEGGRVVDDGDPTTVIERYRAAARA
ncbi:MAG: energy-coupling factor ABC transporter ATP-binding protein [Desertimonas sp.]